MLSDRIDSILFGDFPAPSGHTIGTSREGRPLVGHVFGEGPRLVSLIAGCHADEPVGPAMLDRWVAHLASLPSDAALLRGTTFAIVPHVNPDGAHRNRPWTRGLFAVRNGVVPLERYLRHVVREAPGEDLEFGFPRAPDDGQARPEARAVAGFLTRLAAGRPFALHGSFHGMGFAAGPWFLLEAGWAGRAGESEGRVPDRTRAMRDALRRAVDASPYALHDVDRGGEKGFWRIDRGFTTRPDSRAMVAHFEALGDLEMARRFRPSSMEWVRSLGGDPLTLVSEMPLFLVPAAAYRGDDPRRPEPLRRLLSMPPDRAAEEAPRMGIVGMPLDDQMRFQLLYLLSALDAIAAPR